MHCPGLPALMALTALAAGCKGRDPEPPGVGGADGDGSTTGAGWEGSATGVEERAGFGSALAFSAGSLWIGAPHGARGALYELTDVEGPALILQGDGRLGAFLSSGSGGVVVGAPLAEVGEASLLGTDGRALLQGGPSAALATIGGPEDWVAAVASGSLDANGQGADSPSRPGSLARAGAVIGLGLPLGPDSLSLSTGSRLPRPGAQDEAGFALGAGDIDGDGEIEWILGAPAGRAVQILSSDLSTIEQTLTAPEAARFGAALAVADVNGDGQLDLLVGAPGAGGWQGEARLYLGPDLDEAVRWEGAEEGEALGTAVAMDADLVGLGAPGGMGRVEVHPSPQLR